MFWGKKKRSFAIPAFFSGLGSACRTSNCLTLNNKPQSSRTPFLCVLPFISNKKKHHQSRSHNALGFLTKWTSLSWCNAFSGVIHLVPDSDARWMQLSPSGELKSGSRPQEQMVTPPPYCHLLPLARQMEGGKAQQGGCTWVGASFPLKDEGTSCPAQFYHPHPRFCPPLSTLPQFSPRQFIHSLLPQKNSFSVSSRRLLSLLFSAKRPILLFNLPRDIKAKWSLHL